MAVGEWRLQYPGVNLSLDRDDLFLARHPSIGTADLVDSDTRPVRGDGRRFGVDHLGGTLIGLALTLEGKTPADIDATSDEVRDVWRADRVRLTAGEVAELRSPRGRSALGRPRRYLQDDDVAKFGLAAATATFETVDDLWYGDEETLHVPFAPAPSGGFVAPFVAPFTTTRASERTDVLIVGGQKPTPLVFEIDNAIANPVVLIGDAIRIAFDGSLAYDDVLRYDARAWVRTITRNGGSAAGMVTPSSTRISQAMLPPGQYGVALRGISQTANAGLTIRHRPAFTNP